MNSDVEPHSLFHCRSLGRECKHEECPTLGRKTSKNQEPNDHTKPNSGFCEPGRHAQTGPAANARVHPDVLLALVFVGEHVADDSRGWLELPQLPTVLR